MAGVVDIEEGDDDCISNVGPDDDSLNSWTIVTHVTDSKDSIALSVLLADLTASFSGWSSIEESILFCNDDIEEPVDIFENMSVNSCPTISSTDSDDGTLEIIYITDRVRVADSEEAKQTIIYSRQSRSYRIDSEINFNHCSKGRCSAFEDRKKRN
jgi:hypothetical protein